MHSMPYRLPLACRREPHGVILHRRLCHDAPTVAPEDEAHGLAQRQAADDVNAVILVANYLLIDLQNHIARLHPRLVRRTTRVHRFNQRAPAAVEAEPQRVIRIERPGELDAEVTARDSTAFEQLV